MRNLPKYRSYSASGAGWFPELPSHWLKSSLKRVVDPLRPITYGIVQAGPDVDEGIPYIRPADMSEERGVVYSDELLKTSVSIAESYTRSAIVRGDLVCSIGPSFGKVMVTPSNLDGANLTQGTARVAIAKEHCSRYFFWVLRSAPSNCQWESSVGGATFRALNLGPLAETTIPRPPVAEQHAIATFLDRETATIDALVAEQRRLIELLKEKRQAVISHAVTKGLDPTVPMKDSGIPWLGKVPEHWDITTTRRISKGVETGGTPSSKSPSEDEADGFPWFTPGDFYDGAIRLADSKRKVARELVESGDAKTFPAFSVLIVSIGATLGKVGFCSESCSSNQQVNAVIPNDRVYGIFLAYSLSVKSEVMRYLSNASTIGIMNQEKTKVISLAVPPLNEQAEIADFLDTETFRVDALVAEAERAIDLLQERRTALISAAVTGKIDVREFAGEEAA